MQVANDGGVRLLTWEEVCEELDRNPDAEIYDLEGRRLKPNAHGVVRPDGNDRDTDVPPDASMARKLREAFGEDADVTVKAYRKQ